MRFGATNLPASAYSPNNTEPTNENNLRSRVDHDSSAGASL